MPTKRSRRAAQDVSRAVNQRKLPAFFTPMMAQRADRLPEGEEWTYELKLDGYRALLFKDGARVSLRSRNDKDLAMMYPTIVANGGGLKAKQAIVDGEIVAVDQLGRPSFQALQHRGSHPKHTVVFYAFDLPYVDGIDLMKAPLEERRAKLLEITTGSRVLFSQTLPGAAADVVSAVQAAGLEGVIAKRKGSHYVPGDRTNDWVKLKLEHNEEFVIGGYRPADHSIDAILVGYYEGGKLRFAGKVRAGFVPNVRRELFKTLTPLHSDECPFVDLPSGSSRWGGGVTADEMKGIRWVNPRLVTQIRFTEWTHEGRLRHAKFLALRSDKKPKTVRREE